MLFNSWTFLLFCIVVFPLYYLLNSRRQRVLLLVASYVFYGSWDWRFLSLLMISTAVDYIVGRRLETTERQGRRKALLLLSIVTNLGILSIFKYFDFFVESLEGLLGGIGIPYEFLRLDVTLPVGISFYTFQTMAYSIDVYRRRIPAEKSLLTFAVFVSLFPQLVAGPIERASRLMPQLGGERIVTLRRVREGGWLILFGLFKKVVIADNLGIIADSIFANPENTSGLMCLLGTYAFAYQIYCDFSGYSDIARGLGKLLGIELMINFNLPYLARNPREFWTRWHISLSTFLRDYLYIPLGGNRMGEWRTYINLSVTMLLGGLWHGASWNFVLWGAFHGLALAIHRAFFMNRGIGILEGRFGHVLSVFCWFHLTCIGWVFFRLQSVGEIWTVLSKIATDLRLDRAAAEASFFLLFFAGLLWLYESWLRNADDPATRPGWSKALGPIAVTVILVCLVLFSPQNAQPFIYFQF